MDSRIEFVGGERGVEVKRTRDGAAFVWTARAVRRVGTVWVGCSRGQLFTAPRECASEADRNAAIDAFVAAARARVSA